MCLSTAPSIYSVFVMCSARLMYSVSCEHHFFCPFNPTCLFRFFYVFCPNDVNHLLPFLSLPVTVFLARAFRLFRLRLPCVFRWPLLFICFYTGVAAVAFMRALTVSMRIIYLLQLKRGASHGSRSFACGVSSLSIP